MAVAMGDAMKGLVERMSEVCQFVIVKVLLHKKDLDLEKSR